MLRKLNTNFGEFLMLVVTQSSTFEKSLLKPSPQLAFVDLNFVEIKKWKHLLGSTEEWPTWPLLTKCSLKKNLWKIWWLFSTWKTLVKNLDILCRPQMHRDADETTEAHIICWKSRPSWTKMSYVGSWNKKNNKTGVCLFTYTGSHNAVFVD